MKSLDEDYTAGALAGIPIFCVNRLYKIQSIVSFIKIQYIFKNILKIQHIYTKTL